MDNKTKKECRRDSPSLAAILIPCIQTLKGSGVTFLLPSSGQKDLQVHVKPIILIQQPHWDFFHFSDFLPKMNSTMSPRKHEDVVCKSTSPSYESLFMSDEEALPNTQCSHDLCFIGTVRRIEMLYWILVSFFMVSV